MNNFKVGIIDYDAGNLRSIQNSFSKLGYESQLIKNPSDLDKFKYLVLPGVGSFGYCVENLKKKKFFQKLKNTIINKKKPTLCICIGMQMLGFNSEESKNIDGLKVFDFQVKKIKKKINTKLPHVGWNGVKMTRNSPFFKKNKYYDFYFDHSYAVTNTNEKFTSIGKCFHNENIICYIEKKNIIACQFHPEKSQENGLKLIKHFMRKFG